MRVIAVAAALWSVAVAISAVGAEQSPASSVAAIAGAAAATSDHVGSAACQRCHDAEYDEWERSLHVQMTRPVADALIVGDFTSGARFSDHGRSYTFATRNGRPAVTIAADGRPSETYQVDYTLGAKRYQGYLSTLDDGRVYVLPVFWHIETGRWVDWKEITPVPDGAHDLKQVWNVNCFNCHATNIVQGFDLRSKTYRTTWTEMGIGCEACHGPGRVHVEMMDAWKKDPLAKPGFPEVFSSRFASPRQNYDLCAYCHGNKKNLFTGFTAGERYEDYALPFLLSDPIPANDPQGEFWPDGRPNRFNRPQALALSGCFKAGDVTCTSCHVAHGSDYPYALKVDITRGREGDALCTQCHAAGSGGSAGSGGASAGSEEGAAGVGATRVYAGVELGRHTFHAADSEGSRCIGCHMSDVNWRLLIRRRDHTFEAPVPELTARYGVPNACTTCHDDRPPEWAARQMDAWWGDGERRARAVALADTMYRAGAGDAAVLPDLARLAVDRSRGFIIRASAADYIGRLATGTVGVGVSGESQTSFGGARGAGADAPAAPAGVAVPPFVVNALIGAAADPEPTVRASAVRSLAAMDHRARQGIVTAVLARLTDDVRVVRLRAAQALLAFDIVRLPGRAGTLLARAQEDLVTSVTMFPDSATNHAERAWLEAQLGNGDLAVQAADAALALEPRFARALVIKGIVAARAGRFDEAVDLWRRARSMDPGYPNLDRMIDEARRRGGR
ncbi:MAG: cytochrome c3 family protein [Acidobacteriota bacterium]